MKYIITIIFNLFVVLIVNAQHDFTSSIDKAEEAFLSKSYKEAIGYYFIASGFNYKCKVPLRKTVEEGIVKIVEAICQKIEVLEGEKLSLEKDTTSLGERNRRVQGEVSRLRIDTTTLGVKMRNLEGEKLSLEKDTASLGERNRMIQGEVSMLRIDTTALGVKIKNLEGEKSSLERDTTSLGERNRMIQGEVSMLRIDTTVLGVKIKNLEGEKSSLERDTTSLGEKIRSLEKDTLNISLLKKIEQEYSDLKDWKRELIDILEESEAVLIDNENKVKAIKLKKVLIEIMEKPDNEGID